MRLNNKIDYYIVYDLDPRTGVYFKVNGILDTFREKGIDTELKKYRCVSFKDALILFKSMVSSQSKYLMMRDIHSWHMLLSYPFLLICILQGKQLIIDIPSPCQTLLNEILYNSSAPILKKIFQIIICIIKGPVPYWFFDILIQYGNEGKYFQIFNNKRTIKIGNGITKDRVKLRSKEYLSHADDIYILGVANLSVAHGFDRIIKSISFWNANNKSKVYFHIVTGHGNKIVVDKLKNLVVYENIEDYVHFYGQLAPEQIQHLYSICDIAVGAIGLYHVGLTESSALKLREYCLAGIPFIYTGIDNDFNDELPFCFQISNDDSIDDIIEIYKNFKDLKQRFNDDEEHQYAVDKLTFQSKILKIKLKK